MERQPPGREGIRGDVRILKSPERAYLATLASLPTKPTYLPNHAQHELLRYWPFAAGAKPSFWWGFIRVGLTSAMARDAEYPRQTNRTVHRSYDGGDRSTRLALLPRDIA